MWPLRLMLTMFSLLAGVKRLPLPRCPEICDVLRGWGLTVHELQEGSGDCDFLGMSMRSGSSLCIKRRNLWRLRLGIEEVLTRNRCSGKALQVLVGHITWACLLRREALVVLDSVYAFIAAHLDETAVLWGSVARELWHIRCLLPLFIELHYSALVICFLWNQF